MASTFAKKHTNYLVSYYLVSFYCFLLFYITIIIVIFLGGALRISFVTYQRKFNLIVPEEGWFGQPKYSTPSKILPTLYRSLFLYFYSSKPFGKFYNLSSILILINLDQEKMFDSILALV